MNRSALARPLPLFLVVVLAVVVDQFVKYLVEATLPFQQSVPVVPLLALYRTYNTGVAFSFLTGSSIWALVALTCVIVVFVTYLWKKTGPERWLAHVGYALVIGGAVGNLIDRVTLGHVVDYILFHTENWSFAVFNLADSFITVGAAAVILDELLAARRPSAEHSDGK